MTEQPVKYNVALAKGHGLQNESLTLLSLWQPGMSSIELAKLAVQQGVLGRATEKRTKDIVSIHFAPRFLIDDANPAKQLKIFLDAGLTSAKLNQILFIHTARANPILRDFITHVYWPYFEAGKLTIGKNDAMRFIERSYEEGRLNQRWSKSITDRIALGLVRSLADFDLAEKGRKSERKILPLHLKKKTLLYLIFDLHFGGFDDTAIVQHADWRLFGLDVMDVVRQCQRFSGDYFILQFSGEFARFSWNYSSREETFRVIAEREF